MWFKINHFLVIKNNLVLLQASFPFNLIALLTAHMLQLLAESKFTYSIYSPGTHDLLFVSRVLSKAHLGTLLSPFVCLTTSVT